MSMSSELQAIMQRRLAKCDVKQEHEQQEQEEQREKKSVVSKSSNDDNTARITKPSSIVTKEPNKEKSPNAASSLSSPPSRFKFSSNTKRSPIAQSKKEEENASPVSDFKRNIALFNQTTPKNLNPRGNVGNNPMKSPVAAKANSPIPFDEAARDHFSGSKVSKKNKTANNDLLKRNYNHQPSPTASSIGRWNMKNTNNNQRRSEVSNVNTNKEKHGGVAKQQTFTGTTVPKLVVAQSSPPPPPPPPPTSSPPSFQQGLQKAAVTKKENTSVAQDLSSSDTDQKSLSLSHVQAMKLKFLLKNPEPRPKSPSKNVAGPPKSTVQSPFTTLKETKVDKTESNVKPISQDGFQDDAVTSSSSVEEKIKGETLADGKDKDELNKAFDQLSPFRDNKVHFQNVPGTKFDDDNISIDGSSKNEAIGAFEQKENLFANFDNVAATLSENAEFSDVGVDWGWNQDFFESGFDAKGGWDKEMITSSDLPLKDEVYVPPPSYDFGPDSMFLPKEDTFEDDDDEETLMEGNTVDSGGVNDIVIKSFDLLKFNPQNSKSCLSSQNPATGNIIMCSIRDKKWYIDELEVSPKIKVVSTMEISCSQINQKMRDVKPCGIKDVLGITGGVQLSKKGREGYVVVLLSLYALGSPSIVEVFAVWHWGSTRDGSSNNPDAVVPAPTADYEYKPSSLVSADGLIFLSATIRRKPVVLVSKPSACSKWVSYFSNHENSQSESIVDMDICPEGKLMTLVFSDGVAYVWNYEDAIGLHPRFSTTNQMNLLYLLEDLSSFDPTSHEERVSGTSDYELNIASQRSCQSVQWLPSLKRLPSTDSTTTVFILAASFHSGAAVYAVPVPKTKGNTISEISKSAASDIPQSKPGEIVAIRPIAFTCELFGGSEGLNQSSTLKWVYAGEGLFPLLATILLRGGRVYIHVGSLELPTERAARESKLIAINTVSMGDFSTDPNTTVKFHGCNVAGYIIAHSLGRLSAFCPTSRKSHGSPALHPNIFIRSLPISSDAMGVDSDGSVLQPFSDFVHIQKTHHFDIKGYQKSPKSSTQYIKILPYQRHWLFRTITGDRISHVARDPSDEFPKGGASTSILLDLDAKLSSAIPLIPRRILRDRRGTYCLVLFEDGSIAPSLSTFNPIIAFGLIKLPAQDRVDVGDIVVRQGKDACFLSLEENIENHVMVLDSEAKRLRIFNILAHKNSLEGNEIAIPIFKQGSSNDVNLVVERITVASDRILLLCSRKADGRQCLFLGGMVKSLARNEFDVLVRKKTTKLWLNDVETFLSITELPVDKYGTHKNVAISTTRRVMILSLGVQLRILSQCNVSVTCGNLAQIGSHTTAFLETYDAGQRLSYLSTFNDNVVGVISSMSSGWGQSLLLVALRPDRIIFTTQRVSNISGSFHVDSLSVPLTLTRPLLLIEPLVTNLFGQVGSTDERNLLLRAIFERFGPKKISNPHKDNEGVGTFGVGITSKLCSLVGSSLGDLLKESEDGKEIAYWVPRLNKRLLDVHGEDLGFSLGTLDDTKHVWYLGPDGNRTELLLLDTFEEWLGKERPSIVGEVGAEMAAETGERTLLNILSNAKGVMDGKHHVDSESETESFDKQGWVRYVGEGRKDEDNLSLYIRFSEGSEELWREKGLRDLSKYENRILLLKQECLDIQPTTSNVDEGEFGKVHPLYDLVFKEDLSYSDPPGIIIEVPRGSALDVGMLHSSSYQSRQRATLEFWFFAPRIPSEVRLVGRSLARDKFREKSDDQNIYFSNGSNDLLWELVATPDGYLEFRTKSGTAFNSKYATSVSHDNSDYDRSDTQDDRGKISFPKETGYGGWNHVTLSFSCLEIYDCNVTLRMQGSFVASANLTFPLSALHEKTPNAPIDDLINDSFLVFGQGAAKGMRFTEIRFWACKRASEDIKMMMYEYLDVAKTKKKFKISIRNKGSNKIQKNNLLMPPRSSDRSKFKTIDRPILQLPGSARRIRNDEEESQGIENDTVTSFADFGSVVSTEDVQVEDDSVNNPYISEYLARKSNNDEENRLGAPSDELHEQVGSLSSHLSITELPLISEEIRRSATAALIRGPPASRHFGGNRGGLHFSAESCNIGNICITGSEKTVIFSPCRIPSGRTYPIGASGAIISDNFDGTEYLCCFLAKDKRIVVFDLMNKIVVVELQMTTKLNYWRFLPTQTHGNTLVFLLITPLGGFHWMPLEDSPRPKQIWRRGRDLQGKKIHSYEEGGSNGLLGSESRSVLALVLASSKGPDDPVEAWCVSVEGGLKPLCTSTNVCGAALFNPGVLHTGPFIPFVITVCSNERNAKEFILRLNRICIDKESETMSVQDTIVEETILCDESDEIAAPTMAMGTAPVAFCLTCEHFIVIIFRSTGYLVVYGFAEDGLTLIDSHKLGRYVVDAAIRTQSEATGVEVVLLICEGENMPDGRIVTINFK